MSEIKATLLLGNRLLSQLMQAMLVQIRCLSRRPNNANSGLGHGFHRQICSPHAGCWLAHCCNRSAIRALHNGRHQDCHGTVQQERIYVAEVGPTRRPLGWFAWPAVLRISNPPECAFRFFDCSLAGGSWRTAARPFTAGAAATR